MSDKFAALIEEMDSFETLSEERFDDMVHDHGFDPEDEELTLRLIAEGWSHCFVFREDRDAEYVHDRPEPTEPTRFTRILKDANFSPFV